MATFIDDPAVTAEYQAIVEAFRPHATDGLIAMTLPQAAGLASTAVADVLEAERHGREIANAEARHAHEDAREVLRRASVEADGLRAQAVAQVEALRAELASAKTAAQAHADRVAALEAVAVQAASRWGHEGGPSPLRDALVAAKVI